MIRTRRLGVEDIDHIREIHEKYYSNFEFPDFFQRFLSQYVITDENDEIIIAGGVRAIAECILITDQTKSRIKIGRALVEAHRIAAATCVYNNVDELHAFVTNENYASHLERHGFERRSPAFSMKVL